MLKTYIPLADSGSRLRYPLIVYHDHVVLYISLFAHINFCVFLLARLTQFPRSLSHCRNVCQGEDRGASWIGDVGAWAVAVGMGESVGEGVSATGVVVKRGLSVSAPRVVMRRAFPSITKTSSEERVSHGRTAGSAASSA